MLAQGKFWGMWFVALSAAAVCADEMPTMSVQPSGQQSSRIGFVGSASAEPGLRQPASVKTPAEPARISGAVERIPAHVPAGHDTQLVGASSRKTAQATPVAGQTGRATPASAQMDFKAPVPPEWPSEMASDHSGAAPSQLNEKLRSAGRVTMLQSAVSSAQPSPINSFNAGPCSGGACSGGPCNASPCDVCSTCQQACCCCDNFWQHRSFLFADFLYLKAFGPDFVHATQQNAGAAGPGTVPFGRAATILQNWQPTFRVGGGVALDNCSSISVAYTQFYSHAFDSLGLPTTTGTGSVISSVLVPGTVNAGTTFSQVSAAYDIDFRTADIMYNRLLLGSGSGYLNYDVGVRYGHLRQDFAQNAQFAQPNNPQSTTVSNNFDGVGLRTGLDGRRRLGDCGLSAYGQGFISVLFGSAQSHYNQTNTLTTATLAANDWESERVLPILEYEVGVSWANCDGRWRLSSGYYTAFWFNTVTTPQYIQAVQNNNFVKLGDTITFSGFVSRLEYRF